MAIRIVRLGGKREPAGEGTRIGTVCRAPAACRSPSSLSGELVRRVVSLTWHRGWPKR